MGNFERRLPILQSQIRSHNPGKPSRSQCFQNGPLAVGHVPHTRPERYKDRSYPVSPNFGRLVSNPFIQECRHFGSHKDIDTRRFCSRLYHCNPLIMPCPCSLHNSQCTCFAYTSLYSSRGIRLSFACC